MNRLVLILCFAILITGCDSSKKKPARIRVAEVGKVVLYYDMIPGLINRGINDQDSLTLVRNYINKWAKRELLLQKAEDNLSPELKSDIDKQVLETHENLVIYQYQRQMMLTKMDTILTDKEIQDYFFENGKNLTLSSNIVKALFIKLPNETPNLGKIRMLVRSDTQNDIQELEKLCYQFAEKFDDFNEQWVSMDKIKAELQKEIENEETFLTRNKYYETHDSASVYILSIRDYRLRSTPAPFEYVKDDIKRIIYNTRRFEFLQSLENGIYNEALKANNFKVY
jgi:hypothetical protein